MSILDKVYRHLNPLPLFSNGFGNFKVLEDLRFLKNQLYNRQYLTKDFKCHPISRLDSARFIQTVKFESPATRYLSMPDHLKTLRLQFINAKAVRTTSSATKNRLINSTGGLCLILATTGDHGFTLRTRSIAVPLAQNYGVSSIVFECPFYGSRKPSNQTRSALLHISDLLLMGLVTLIECTHLVDWALESSNIRSDQSLLICGNSLGAFIASMWTASYPCYLPALGSVLCLSGSSAAPVFTQGVLSQSVDWSRMFEQCDSFVNNCDFFLPDGVKHLNADFSSSFERVKYSKLIVGFLLDYFTDLNNWQIPANSFAITLMEAKRDLYIPNAYGLRLLNQIWMDRCRLEFIDCGHVYGTIVAYRKLLRQYLERMISDQTLHYNSIDFKSAGNGYPRSGSFTVSSTGTTNGPTDPFN